MSLRIKQYAVSGPSGGVPFLPPSRVERKLHFFTLEEAVHEAKSLHEQFGDVFAVWFRQRIVGTFDARGYVMLVPGFRPRL